MNRFSVRWRAIAWAAGSAAIMASAAIGYLLRDPLPWFVERRSALAQVTTSAPSTEFGYIYTPVRITGTSGLAVDLVVRRAVEDSGRTLPIAVILGGHLAGADAARMLGDTRGVLVAAVSYPFTGDPRPSTTTFLREIPKIRGAFLDTPAALMLTLDYVRRLPRVDSTHVEGIGVSLGAPFVGIAGAIDPRFTRVWAIHGSGGSYAPLELNMRRSIPFAPARMLAAGVANVIIAGPRLDPSRWVDRIAPRQFVMVNASEDERMPRAEVDRLFQSARQPKEQIWMSGGHVHGDSATITRLVNIVMERVRDPVSATVLPTAASVNPPRDLHTAENH